MAELRDADLAAGIRVGVDYDTLDPQIQRIITRLNVSCTAYVRAHTDRAPQEVENEAIIRMAGYLYDAPPVTRFGVAFRESGAQALVDPWKIRAMPLAETP